MLGVRPASPPPFGPSHCPDTPPFHSPFQALYVYEYAITLLAEIRYVWRHTYSFATFLFAFNRYVVWIETALQLYITFGDLMTVDVSGTFISRPIGIDYRSVGNLAVSVRLFGIRRKSSLIGFALIRCTKMNKAFSIIVACHKICIGRTSPTPPSIDARAQPDIHSILCVSSVRYLGPPVECFLDHPAVVCCTHGVIPCTLLSLLSHSLDPNSC